MDLCAGGKLAALDGPDVFHVRVKEDYRPSGRLLARAGEIARTLEDPRKATEVWIYREGKRYGRIILSFYLEVLAR